MLNSKLFTWHTLLLIVLIALIWHVLAKPIHNYLDGANTNV
jgi:F0F1-type ATP synthase membrane subunit b/b'